MDVYSTAEWHVSSLSDDVDQADFKPNITQTLIMTQSTPK